TCFEDPLAQWFIKHRSAGTADHMKSWAWNHMLPIAVVTLYDPLVKETGPNLPRMPLARSFANEPRLVPGVRGVTIMRTGYDRTADIQLALRCGDYGGWHGHPDQGSFVLNAYGDRMVVDFALGAPYGTPKNNFSKSALAHSGVLVDEKGQVEYSSPVFHNREAGRTGPLMHTRFIDHVMADMTVAFSKNRKIRKMEHAHRYFLFVRRPDHRAYIVVFDSLQMDQREHAWDWMLQTDTKHTIKADRPNHHVIQGKADLHVFTLEPKAVEMEKSDHFGLWRTMKLMNPDDVKHATFLHVLYPTEKGAPIPEIQRKASARAVGATVGEELFTVRRGAGVIALGGISTDGRIAGVSQKDGKLNWFLCVRGKSLEFGGKPVFLSDSPVTVAVDSFGSGTIIADQEAELTANIGGKELKLKASKGTSHLLNGKVKE
ncbi:MAG: heparinase II/III family protein, partial [Planctomycetota bacterium]|nr:heparinase II/III family protein [Planctomycetota bacterium]